MKVNGKKAVIILFVMFSILVDFAYLGNYDFLKWVDIPSHFFGGMLVAAFISRKHLKKRLFFSLILIAAIGLGWEGFEFAMAYHRVLDSLFEETIADRISDLTVGLGGLLFSYYAKG